MSSLLVIWGTLAAFHHERSVGTGEIGKNVQIEACSQVIRVGNKHVFVTILEEGVEASRSFERGIEISVTRRTPFVGRIAIAGGRLESCGVQLWYLILHHFKTLFSSEFGVVFLEKVESIFAGREGVHQHKFDLHAEFLSHLDDLLCRQIQKCVIALDFQERLGLVQSHTSSKTSVKFQHNGFRQNRSISISRERFGFDKIRCGGDGRFGDQTSVSRNKRIKCGFEGRDCRWGNFLGLHFGANIVERRHLVSIFIK
mmetsp:Transcript_23650/g.50308  ORF Transcript_23650/g.50308 Transcript_23650/m.50308 type:complete len:256 (-) Transcript_23650:43-810(-)